MMSSYKSETVDLIKILNESGMTVTAARYDNTERWVTDPDEWVPVVMACDCGYLRVEWPGGAWSWLFLVYGNDPGELVCDYGVPTDLEFAKALDEATARHNRKWED